LDAKGEREVTLVSEMSTIRSEHMLCCVILRRVTKDHCLHVVPVPVLQQSNSMVVLFF